MNIRKIFFPVIIFFFSINLLFAQNDKNSVYAKLLEKFNGVSTLSIKFQMRGNKDFQGTIRLKKSDKYFLQTKNMVIVCNGKSVWNFNPSTNTVTISPYESSETEISLEKFFFSYLKLLKPVSLSRVLDSDGKSSNLLELEAETTLSDKIDLRKISLWLDTKSLNIYTLEIESGSGNYTWDIEKMTLNPKISDNTFIFNVPKKAKVVDLR